jgi:SAM-dependent methyltransferase
LTGLFRWLYLHFAEKLYREWSALYDPVSVMMSLGSWDRWRESALHLVTGESVLELGSGTGHLLSAIARTGKRAVGVDISPMMAARAAHRQPSSSRLAMLVQASADSLPFVDGVFDTVVSTFPTAYILNSQTVSECGRVTRGARPDSPYGRLAVVGLWVRTESPIVDWLLPVFYGGPDRRVIGAYVVALQKVGYSPAVIERPIGRFRVGIVAACKTR